MTDFNVLAVLIAITVLVGLVFCMFRTDWIPRRLALALIVAAGFVCGDFLSALEGIVVAIVIAAAAWTIQPSRPHN